MRHFVSLCLQWSKSQSKCKNLNFFWVVNPLSQMTIIIFNQNKSPLSSIIQQIPSNNVRFPLSAPGLCFNKGATWEQRVEVLFPLSVWVTLGLMCHQGFPLKKKEELPTSFPPPPFLSKQKKYEINSSALTHQQIPQNTRNCPGCRGYTTSSEPE